MLNALRRTRFNPSQVGYKPIRSEKTRTGTHRFNPSQVGYKRAGNGIGSQRILSFNPSQVGYKLGTRVPYALYHQLFQSLTGRLQTCPIFALCARFSKFQSLTGRLQT